jgi:uroporphyrinogen decarboxylase
MNARQRVTMALDHQEPDRVPMDLGGTAVSTLRIEAFEPFMTFLGLPTPEPTLVSTTFRTVEVAETARQRLGVDFLGLRPHMIDGWQNTVHSPDAFTDEWGISYSRPDGSIGAFFPVRHPLAGADLEAIRSYVLPHMGDLSRVSGLGQLAERLYNSTDYALIADGMWPLLQRAYDLRGMDTFLMDMATDETLARNLLDRITEATLLNISIFLQAVGPYCNVVTIADDLGVQNGPVMSAGMYRRCLKPYHQALIAEIHRHTNAKIFLHCDGSIVKLLPDIIDAGFDIINPVQASARGMDTAFLKREFGAQLSFWGGVDTQHVMPYGSTADVADEVARRIDDLAPGGGFILGAVHNIQGDVPPANVLALFEAGCYCGRYHTVS